VLADRYEAALFAVTNTGIRRRPGNGQAPLSWITPGRPIEVCVLRRRAGHTGPMDQIRRPPAYPKTSCIQRLWARYIAFAKARQELVPGSQPPHPSGTECSLPPLLGHYAYN